MEDFCRRILSTILLLLVCQELTLSFADDVEVVDLTKPVEDTVPEWDDNGYIMFCPCMGMLPSFVGTILIRFKLSVALFNLYMRY